MNVGASRLNIAFLPLRLQWLMVPSLSLRAQASRPIFSLLFLLVIEILLRFLDNDVLHGFLRGFSIGGRHRLELHICHLLFADDTIILCEDDREQHVCLKAFLNWFEVVSGLRVNLSKSAIVLVGLMMGIKSLSRLRYANGSDIA